MRVDPSRLASGKGRPTGHSAGAANRRRGAAVDPLVCFCNRVPQSAIEAAVRGGARTLAQVFDATWAGCGPCGGSCQPALQQLLEDLTEQEGADAP